MLLTFKNKSIKFYTGNMHLATCEIYNPCIHGHDEASSPGITGHFLCSYVVSEDTMFDPTGYPFIFLLQLHNCRTEWSVQDTAYWKQSNNGTSLPDQVAASILRYGHPVIRNYWSIIRTRGTRMLELVELVTLDPGGECVCVIKTFWLRIFQRRVKAWIRNKQRVRQLLSDTRWLMLRECGFVSTHHHILK